MVSTFTIALEIHIHALISKQTIQHINFIGVRCTLYVKSTLYTHQATYKYTLNQDKLLFNTVSLDSHIAAERLT